MPKTTHTDCSCNSRRYYACECTSSPLPIKWHGGSRAPRLAAIAKWINENTTLVAMTEATEVSTDTSYGLVRVEGKGRSGNKLTVATTEQSARSARWGLGYDPNVVLCHNAAQTYRHNGEVVQTLHNYLTKHPECLKV